MSHSSLNKLNKAKPRCEKQDAALQAPKALIKGEADRQHGDKRLKLDLGSQEPQQMAFVKVEPFLEEQGDEGEVKAKAKSEQRLKLKPGMKRVRMELVQESGASIGGLAQERVLLEDLQVILYEGHQVKEEDLAIGPEVWHQPAPSTSVMDQEATKAPKPILQQSGNCSGKPSSSRDNCKKTKNISHKEMLNPGCSKVSAGVGHLEELVDSDDDDVDSDDDIVIEEVEEVEDFLVQEDGSLVSALAAEAYHSFSDEDYEEELARTEVQRCISPLSRPGSPMSTSPPRLDAAGDDAPMPGGSGNGAGRRGAVRGWRVPGRGRRGRGGYGMRGRSVRGVGARLRSDPLVERFQSDQVVPAQLQQEIERLTADRIRRGRAARERRAANRANVEEASDAENDEEEEESMGGEEFVWESMDEWNGVKESFLPENSGPTRSFQNAYDAFRSYWDDSLLSHIADETNRYAQGIRSESFQRGWFNTNLDEILLLFAFWMMMGIIRMPTIKSCFSTLPLLRTDVFRRLFSEKRYWNLNRAFHLANGSRDRNDPDNVLHPMGPVIDQLNSKFKQNYTLHQDICIDESLTLWKGPLRFKQFIRTKTARFGIKTYQLCESSTGYLWSFFVYIGRKTTTSTLPSSISYVVKLVEPLLNLGHVLYMDNWFNSPTLARYLKRRRTDCVGTLRSTRAYMPALLQMAPLAEGEFVARQSGDVMLVTLQDHKRFTCISTFHGVDQVQKTGKPGRPAHFKLKLIDDYNRHMGGVDRLDQMLEPYLIERKQCLKWYRKLFKRLLNITIQNARVLLEKSSDTTICPFTFRLALVQAIIDHHKHKVPTRHAPHVSRMTHPYFPAERLTERHFIRRIPITEEMRASIRHSQNLGRRQCVWCSANATSHRKKSTAYECPKCYVALCLDFCFEQFHTVP